ncbi:hypothetical protein PRZ48_013353 [Zasmidium cellare]|uniref:Uncharacterized protein n=1 Tax=Zasmidium cellare TaxID=395010 RepID=A0ABR0E1F0_ZASCE|nr:hypothetical protein PRZ48_013353 [Zasmidium cellare]
MKRLAAILLASVISGVVCDNLDPTLKHANHIFNEIHSSARQWGSTLNHNGMAFFMATVPEGTELYHGTSSASPKIGMDWLAFEPEHALVFARPGSNRPDDDRNEEHPRHKAVTHGYLHTFRAQHDLRLLYLDGASAAKSDRGTLDLQDVVLLNQMPKAMTGRRSFYEHEEDSARAAGLCHMAQEDWRGKVDGFIRMEAGFEIILCDFESHLELVRVTQSKSQDSATGAIPDSPAFFKAIAGRYDGIGGDRIAIDYETQVSLFAYPDALYFDGWRRPRVNHTGAVIEAVRNAVTSMVLSEIPRSKRRTNWQSVADMVVGRYADRIEYLASGEIDLLTDLRFEAERSLRPFIDYSRLDKSAEISRPPECKHGSSSDHRSQHNDMRDALKDRTFEA